MPAAPPATPADEPFPSRIKFLAWLGLAGIAEFIVALLALHATAVTSEPWHMSDFARSQYQWLWVAGAYSFAVAGVALTLALQAHLPGSPLAKAGLVLLWISALGATLIATFPTDSTAQASTVSGNIHNDAVWPTFGAVGIAMVLIGPVLRSRRSWRPFADASVVLGLLVAAGGIAYYLTDTHGMAQVAIVQRLLVATIAFWFVLLGLNLLAIRPRRTGAGLAATAAVALRGGGIAAPEAGSRGQRGIAADRPVGLAQGAPSATQGAGPENASAEGELRPPPHKT